MSAAVAAAAAAACVSSNNTTSHTHHQRNQQNYRSVSFFPPSPAPAALLPALSRYESQKRRDWSTFVQYLKNHCPNLALSRCTGAHVLEFLKYLDQFGETKVHTQNCPFFGHPHSPTPCSCPLKEAWGSLDAIIGRLRAAYEENGGGQSDPMNPFRAPEVRVYLREVRDAQAEARGIAYI